MSEIKRIYHPLIFSIFPIISYYFDHSSSFSFEVILWPVFISIVSLFVTFYLLLKIIKNKDKTAIVLSLFYSLFFAYGKFFIYLEGIYFKLGKFEIGANKIIFTVGIIFIVSILVLVKTIKSNFKNITKIFNIIALTLVSISLFLFISSYDYSSKSFEIKPTTDSLELIDNINIQPDIYYIILDGYAREDLLEKNYSFNNSRFICFLEELGFVIKDDAIANYMYTTHSLASSLNMTYLDSLSDLLGKEYNDVKPLRKIIQNNKVFTFLKSRGYKTISFASGYFATEIPDADLYLSQKWNVGEFSNALIMSTPLNAILKLFFNRDMHIVHRNRILYIFNRLKSLADFKKPFVAFAHIIAPHPPFVFNKQGNLPQNLRPFNLWPGDYDFNEYRKLYTNQLTFVNRALKETVETILKKSSNPPIIILQADHGPGPKIDFLSNKLPSDSIILERMSIFNAIYYPPPFCSLGLNVRSPVNRFREIFNCYFGAEYKFLSNDSYFSSREKPYEFIDISKRISQEKPQ